ncbi:glycosyltransferase family A protein [Marinoscillum sp.]|uniref:glycosyltransferase family A protein n=1 Tax=Marinoscillum sp. TaxID=2024838 RepID=UPI003BA9456D
MRSTKPQKWIDHLPGKPSSKAVISLSVLPARFKHFEPTLNSITDQTVLPEKIIINLPRTFKRDKTNYEIPDYVKNHPLIHINWIEEDMGPATKILPTLELYKDEPERLIIVLDDDQIYPQGMVENYVNNSEQLPDAALTLSGWVVPDSFDHGDKKQLYGAIVRVYRPDTSVTNPVRVDCLQGAASFAVKPKLFDERVFDFDNAPSEAFFVDDIWLSGNLSRNNSPVYVVPAPFRFGRFVSLRQSTKVSLSRTVNSDNSNNNTLYRYFEKEWWSLNK